MESPAVGELVISFPTPERSDIIVAEKVSVKEGDYVAIPYGTPHPDSTNYPGLKLVYEAPIEGSAKFNIRYWATDRLDQDLYNYTVTYIGESGAHRVRTRSYVVPREDYERGESLSFLDEFPQELLVSEKMEPLDDQTLRSIFVRVTRIYEEFATRAQQDAWNSQFDYPYLKTDNPRITRTYRFVAGTAPDWDTVTTDTEVTDARLTAFQKKDESKEIETWVCVFESIPVKASTTVFSQDELGYSVSYPYCNDEAFPVVSWVTTEWRASYVANDSAGADDINPCPIAGYTTLELVREYTKGDDNPSKIMVFREYEQVPGKIISSTRMLDSGIVGTQTTQVVAKDTLASECGELLISSQVVPRPGYDYAIKTEFTKSEHETRIDWAVDPELRLPVKITTTILDNPVDEPEVVPGQDVEVRWINNCTSAFIVREVQYTLDEDNLIAAAGRTEERWVDYTFPELLVGEPATDSIVSFDTDSVRTRIQFNRRARYSRKVVATIYVTYAEEEQYLPDRTVFSMKPNTLVYRGLFFDVAESNVLNDEFTIPYTTGSDSRQWPLAVEACNASASEPSATTYVDTYIGELAFIGSQNTRGRYGLWRQEAVEITLE